MEKTDDDDDDDEDENVDVVNTQKTETSQKAANKSFLEDFAQYISSDKTNEANSSMLDSQDTTENEDKSTEYEKRVIKKMSAFKNCVKM